MTTAPTRIFTDIDLDADGETHGYLRLPLAVHTTSDGEAGYGYTGIPIVSLRNGDGPTVLLMAGNHGNEYEGQVVLMRLLQRLRAADLTGQLIVLPAANAPAVAADQRTSPLDGGNLNRNFPGRPDGQPTEMIAHFIESHILPRVQFAFDLHSGGKTGEYLPVAVVARSDDPDRFARSLDMLRAFGMPNSMIIDHSTGGDASLIGACRRTGVFHLSTELGGGASVGREEVRLAEHGVLRLLHHVGLLRTPLTTEPPATTTMLHRTPAHEYIYAGSTERGLFEPLVSLGDQVSQGQVVGLIRYTTAPWREPEPVVSPCDGVVLARRIPARTGLGDFVFVLGRPWEDGA
ncbi:succinylglutamate desuccinylase/aspartoacylase family protein [Streptomyces sp. NPDC001508]|uniref:succinylglutamate desuccinylase/aspartoacylase domain-containing protein n=1 Tax=Streptomyces sp. NPDC001508 TaxID=3154656 RepID=UPI0033312EAA